jgi:DNA-binding CsgD family transcriptional regulator
MKRNYPTPIVTRSTFAFHLDPTLTGEEAMVLRALAGGQTESQVCKDLNMDPAAFLRLMRRMRAKIGTLDDPSLIAWAKLQIRDVDQRIDRPQRICPPRLA